MSNNKENNAFIKHLHLKGFKSIVDLEVSLQNGLNVVIGANGSGKTNFVEFLKYALRGNRSEELKQPYSFNVLFETAEGDVKIEEHLSNQVRHRDYEIGISSVSTKIININKNEEFNIENRNIYGALHKSNNFFLALYFTPKAIPFNSEAAFNGSTFTELGHIIIGIGKNLSIRATYDVFEEKFYELEEKIMFAQSEVMELKENMHTYLILKKRLIENLKSFSPIKDLRLSDSLKIEQIGDRVEVSFILLEFYVNGTWLKWEQLSDGTKRIFHIIYQIINSRKLVLLEEPENGVHPDQLYLLMDFIKEQAKEKQIIVTTHSPEVLNFIEKDELDRIIVTRYDNEKKTQMHHLSEKTKKKAIRYMENKGMLSDCWVHTNYFEKYDEAEYEA